MTAAGLKAPHREPTSDWIRVEDRLPAAFMAVDVWVVGSVEDVSFWCPPFKHVRSGRVPGAYLDADGRWRTFGGLVHHIVPTVTHWMPIPEPPVSQAEAEARGMDR